MEVNKKLSVLTSECFEEAYSYGCMGLEDMAKAIESSSEKTELALSCLSLSYQ